MRGILECLLLIGNSLGMTELRKVMRSSACIFSYLSVTGILNNGKHMSGIQPKTHFGFQIIRLELMFKMKIKRGNIKFCILNL